MGLKCAINFFSTVSSSWANRISIHPCTKKQQTKESQPSPFHSSLFLSLSSTAIAFKAVYYLGQRNKTRNILIKQADLTQLTAHEEHLEVFCSPLFYVIDRRKPWAGSGGKEQGEGWGRDTSSPLMFSVWLEIQFGCPRPDMNCRIKQRD